MTKNIIYKAEVSTTDQDQTTKTYIGMTSVEYFGNALFGWLWSGRDYCWITLLLDFELWTKAQCEVELPGDVKKGKSCNFRGELIIVV